MAIGLLPIFTRSPLGERRNIEYFMVEYESWLLCQLRRRMLIISRSARREGCMCVCVGVEEIITSLNCCRNIYDTFADCCFFCASNVYRASVALGTVMRLCCMTCHIA